VNLIRAFRTVFFVLPWLSLAACGGSSGASSPSAPSGLGYSAHPAFTVGKAITPLIPTVAGQVTHYTVSPALPAGLSVNGVTGTIAGTPTEAAAQATYTVTAGNSAGSTTASVVIVVNPTAPTIDYASPAYSFTVGVTAGPIKPTVSAGLVTSWGISPALPAGLAFSTTTGAISGTPASAVPSSTYVVTASDGGSTSTVNLTIAVASGPLVDLGHASALYFTRLVSNTLLSEDTQAHWILWNYSAGTQIANGNTELTNPKASPTPPLPVDLEGLTAVVQTSTGLEVRSATTGTVSAEITTSPSWWKLASDGSYVCAGDAAGLTAWSTTGGVLFTIAGNYSQAIAYAAASQIQVANGPSGTNVIQTITVSTGTATTSPQFQGTFQSWFADGSHFFSAVLSTSSASTWWVYSAAAIQQDLANINSQSLAGSGTWYWWIANGTFNLSSVGAHGTVSNSYSVGILAQTIAVAAASTVGIISTANFPSGQLILLDLSGATPASTTYTLPFGDSTTYGATSSSTWMVGTRFGVLLDGASLAGTARYLDYGEATSMSGSSNNVVIATASGRVLTFDPATHALLDTIDSQVGKLVVSSDGTALAALAGGSDFIASTDDTLTVYQLPAGTVIAAYPYTTSDVPRPVDMTLSGSGTVLGEIFNSASPCLAQTIPVSAGSTLWCDTAPGVDLLLGNPVAALQLSPDGTGVAEVEGSGSAATTSIYSNGKLATALTATVLCWLDNSELLGEVTVNGVKAETYQGAYIYSSTGTVISPIPTLPQIPSAQMIPSSSTTPATSIYAAAFNSVYSLSTGSVIWTSGSPMSVGNATGAVSGSYIVFESQNLVLAESY
jgi:hypothetical protein